MAQVTLDGGQSSAALGGQTIAYVTQVVAQTIPGAPDTLIQTHLQRVLNEFYTRSTALRQNVGPYPIQQGVQQIDLNPVDQNLRLQFVLGAFFMPFNGSTTPFQLQPLTRQWFGGTPAPPVSYYMQTADQMIVYPVPDKDYSDILYVYGSMVPTTLSAVLPDVSYTQHADALIWGTLARLYAIPKRPWTDKQGASDNMRLYRREIMQARDIAERGYGPADIITRVPSFAGRSGSQIYPRASG